jgi:hypothetical protein
LPLSEVGQGKLGCSEGESPRPAIKRWGIWLELFKNYYNAARVHQGLSGDTPEEKAGGPTPQPAGLENYRWQSHRLGMFELPIAA